MTNTNALQIVREILGYSEKGLHVLKTLKENAKETQDGEYSNIINNLSKINTLRKFFEEQDNKGIDTKNYNQQKLL